MNHTALDFAEANTLSDCLDVLESELRQHADLDGYLINLYASEDDTLICSRVRLPAAMSSVEASFRNYRFPINPEDANGMAFRSRETVEITSQSVVNYHESTQTRFKLWAFQHLVTIPILHAGSQRIPVGVLSLFSQRGELPRPIIEQSTTLCQDAAATLRLHQEATRWEARSQTIRDTEAELKSLLEFVAEMSNLSTDREIFPRIQEEFLERFEMDLAAILLHEDGELRCVAEKMGSDDIPWAEAWKAHCKQLRFKTDIADGATADVFVNNHSLFIADVPGILHLQMSEKDRAGLTIAEGMLSFAMIPIRKHGAPIGVLWLASVKRRDALTSGQLVMVQLLCDFLGSTIENSRNYTLVETQRHEIEALVAALQNKVVALDHLANRDRLTGLYNFGSFEAEANKSISGYRHQRKPLPLSLIMCDVDRFKIFNDTFGHVAGNVVLKEVAARISATVRDSDYVARYGGEEFSILLPRCDIEAAARLAERIRAKVADEPFIVDGVKHHVTLSLGCAQYSKFFDKLTDFTAHADVALYAAKRGGRNRVEKAELL